MSLIPFVLKPAVAEVGLPTTPGTPYLVSSTETTLTVAFSPSSDPSGVAGYRAYIAAAPGTPARVSALNVDTVPTTFTFTGLSPATAYKVAFQAVDVWGNAGALSGEFTTSAEASLVIKFNPGIYVMGTSRSAYTSSHLADLSSLSAVKGWHQYLHWSTVETARGVYDWTFLDGLLAVCETYGLRLIINLKPRTFGGSGTSHLPSYLATEPGGNGGWHTFSGSKGVMPRIWLPAINDRFIALFEAILGRYNSHPLLEAVEASETSVSDFGEISDFDYQDYLDEQLRCNEAMVAAGPNTLIFGMMNYADSQSQLATFMADNAAARVGFAYPDTFPQVTGIGGSPPQNLQWSERIAKGQVWNGSSWVSGGTEYRGVVPIHAHTADPELGGKEGSWTPAQFYDQVFGDMRATHWSFSRKDYTISGEPDPAYEDIYWNTGSQPRIRDWISASGPSSPLVTTFPTALSDAGYSPLTGGT